MLLKLLGQNLISIQLIAPAMQTRSLAQMSLEEGFDAKRHGTNTIRIGVDARSVVCSITAYLADTLSIRSIWMVQCAMVFSVPGTHWQTGKNPELRTLFYKVLSLIGICASIIFVFDGEERPDVKRNTRVPKTPHWLSEAFQEIITACGFDFYTVRLNESSKQA